MTDIPEDSNQVDGSCQLCHCHVARSIPLVSVKLQWCVCPVTCARNCTLEVCNVGPASVNLILSKDKLIPKS